MPEMLYNYDGSELTLGQLRTSLSDAISMLRQGTLDKFQRSSPGVSRVYSENLLAATRYNAGVVLTMANGMTPTDYLTGLGAPLGMHASQFATYILGENLRLGVSAYSVEQDYLVGKALFATSEDGNAMIAFFEAYKVKCASVVGA